jgi:hypothetical protein
MKVRFYESAAGRAPVKDYLADLPSDQSDPMYAAIEDI